MKRSVRARCEHFRMYAANSSTAMSETLTLSTSCKCDPMMIFSANGLDDQPNGQRTTSAVLGCEGAVTLSVLSALKSIRWLACGEEGPSELCEPLSVMTTFSSRMPVGPGATVTVYEAACNSVRTLFDKVLSEFCCNAHEPEVTILRTCFHRCFATARRRSSPVCNFLFRSVNKLPRRPPSQAPELLSSPPTAPLVRGDELVVLVVAWCRTNGESFAASFSAMTLSRQRDAVALTLNA